MKVKDFFKKFGIGALIGGAMIIPGVSGGTIAVLLNIYDKLISAISDLRKDFKNSFFFLLPIVLGAVVAVGALIIPLQYAIEYIPVPTILLFMGLIIGSVPKLIKDGLKNGFTKLNILSVLLPLAAVVGICFIPSLGEANLGADMEVWGYFVLILMGALASCALVVPGVSGSMLLLIFGYYSPILATVKGLFTSFGHSLLVLVLFALGLVIGFFSIAKLMKLLLKKLPRGTFWSIIGFVIGSIPAFLFTEEFKTAQFNTVNIVVGVILGIAGVIASYAITAVTEAKAKKAVAASAETSNKTDIETDENPDAETEN